MGTNLKECSISGAVAAAGTTLDVLPGYEFKVINKNGSDYIIRFLKWVDNPEKNKRFVSEAGTPDDEQTWKYFLLPIADYNPKAETVLAKHAFTIGALTVPIKMRFGDKKANGDPLRDFTFSGDVSLGFSLGYKYSPSKRHAFNALTGVSITSVPISPQTTKNLITNETNVAAVTWHIGLLSEVDNFQFGVFSGIDYLAGETGRRWIYRNQPWLGIAIGYSLLQSKKTNTSQSD
jgi:hypothetical protein